MADWPRDPDDENRDAVQRQGNIMFWLTLACGAAILLAAVIYALVV
jgi:hypothetical protein